MNAMDPTVSTALEPAPLYRASLRQRLANRALPVYTGLAVLYLFLPVAVMVAFSFNNPKGRQNITWQGFTFDNYLTIWNRPDITDPMIRSLVVAVISTIVATALGTLIGLALTRYSFRGRDTTNILIFLPMATPEIIMGASLLSLWVSLGVSRSLFTIVIAHVMFNISYVVVTIRARLQGFNRAYEEAAMDLGADEWATFRKVTFPLIFPGILAAALLAFALSIDDYVITSFVAGNTVTFPLWVYGVSRLGVPPEVNVLGTLIFVIAFGFMAGQILWQRRKARPAPVTGA
jgi:spermidine/putrescine transport system permease protein